MERGSYRHGREHGEAWCRNADTSFYFSVFSRAVGRVDLTTYGLVRSMTGHMTALQEKGGRGKAGEGGGRMSEGVMNTVSSSACSTNGNLRTSGPIDYRTHRHKHPEGEGICPSKWLY